jgi:hypothetical protein
MPLNSNKLLQFYYLASWFFPVAEKSHWKNHFPALNTQPFIQEL